MTSELQQRLDALEKAYSSGTKRLTYEGKTIEYRDLSEMERAINSLQRQIEAESGERRSRQVRMKTRRGI